MVHKAFKALERISIERGFLNYYLNLILKIIKQATFCKPSDIPEVLVDTMREDNNELMMDSNSSIPYHYVNEICLSSLNKVIRKA